MPALCSYWERKWVASGSFVKCSCTFRGASAQPSQPADSSRMKPHHQDTTGALCQPGLQHLFCCSDLQTLKQRPVHLTFLVSTPEQEGCISWCRGMGMLASDKRMRNLSPPPGSQIPMGDSSFLFLVSSSFHPVIFESIPPTSSESSMRDSVCFT